MSPSLPVPSKGALRALRRIALGTSCTIAFGAGLITEDRRRRIRTAREASENARRLKTSRTYHSAGLSVATTFEEQVENYCRYGPWKSDRQRILDPEWNDAPQSSVPMTQKSNIKSKTSSDTLSSAPSKFRSFGRNDATKTTNWQMQSPVEHPKNCEPTASSLLNPIRPPKTGDSKDSVLINETANLDTGQAPPARSFRKSESIRSQTQLASQMSKVLNEPGCDGITRLVEAVSIFHVAFKGTTSVQAVDQDLLDACILLSQECDHYGKMDIFIPVLAKMLSCWHPVDEESLSKLHVEKAISRLLEQSGYRHANHQVVANVDKLKHAVAIFMAETCDKPKPLPMELREVGLQLCTATLRANLYDLTEAVCRRLLHAQTNFTASEVECLILADHRRASWDQVLHHFSKYFPETVPDQNQLYAVAGAAIDSALILGKIDAAEEVLLTASQMAMDKDLRTSTTWHLRVLGEHWRATRDIVTTRALFGRLVPFSEQTSHPHAIYSAMIQFCIEAGSEGEVQRYLERLSQLNSGESMDVRTYGHLALAKAMKNNWAGVEADFRFMKKFARDSTHDHSEIFVPILKLFVSSHDVGQVEGFVRLYFEDLDVAPNQYIFNIVVDAYCKAGELSNIPRWVEYARQHGLQVDTVTVNTILSRCRKQWAAHPDDLVKLYKEINKRFGFICDSTTVQILHRAATSSATACHAARLIQQVGPPSDVRCENIEAKMRRALERGDDAKVLNSYKFAMQSGKRISLQGFSIAVRASIRSTADGDLASTVKLIVDARSRGLDVSPSIAHLLLHEVITSSCDGDDLVSLVKHTLAEFDKRGLMVTLSIVSKIISELIDRGKPEEALMFWKTLASHEHIAGQPVDLVLLTVLLRAHIMLSDLEGIKWVISMLLKNNIIPDKQFRIVVKRARQEARRFLNARPDSFNARQRYEVLDESLRLVVTQRLTGESKRKEAEQLTLSMLETALAVERDNTRIKSRVGSLDTLPIKTSDRLTRHSKIRERQGKCGTLKKRQGMTNMLKSGLEDQPRRPENTSLMVREEDTGDAGGHGATGSEILEGEHTEDDNRMATPRTKSRKALPTTKEFDVHYHKGYPESPAHTVEVASG